MHAGIESTLTDGNPHCAAAGQCTAAAANQCTAAAGAAGQCTVAAGDAAAAASDAGQCTALLVVSALLLRVPASDPPQAETMKDGTGTL